MGRACLVVHLVIAFPSSRTHERLYTLWGLLATSRRTFHRFSRFAHLLACQLAHDCRFRFSAR